MSACWTLFVLLLCARGPRAEDPDPERDALEPGRAGTLTRGARRGAPPAGFSPEKMEPSPRAPELNPGDRSISPGGRSASPGDRSASPGGRSISPGGRSASPGDRSASPGGRSASPGDRSASPGDRSASPGGRSASPGGRSISPGDRSASPGGRSASPGGRSVSPGDRSASLGGRSASPGDRSASPGDRSASPGGRSASPGDRSASPGDRRRFSRGVKGSWRRRDRGSLSTLDPDRYFTTPRTAPPRIAPAVNASVRAALLPLGGGARWAYAVLLLALVLFSVGLVGNLALMCLVWHSLHLKSAWNCVLAGLALWDFLVLFLCLPVLLFHQLTGARLALSCSLVPFLEVSSMGVATFSLCALSIDRFHSATSPAPLSVHVESCTSILPKLAVVFVGALLLATPELLTHRHLSLPLQEHTQVDVCVAEPSPELPLAVLSLVLTYQEARSWWVFGCYLCLPLLFTLSCDLVTRRVMSQRAAHVIGRQEGNSRSSSPSIVKKEVGLNRSPALSVSKQEVSSHTSSLNRKLVEREAGLRSVILALIGLYTACTLPEAVCSVAVSYLPALPVGVSPALRLIGQFLLFARCSATPLLALAFSRALGGAFLHCCCCCCDECGATPPPATPTSSMATPTPSLATPSTLLATPLSALAPPLRDTPTEEQRRALGTPC